MQHYERYKASGVEWLGEIPAHWDVRPGFTCFKENKDRNKGLVENTVLSLSYGRIVIKPEEKLTAATQLTHQCSAHTAHSPR